MPLPENPIHTPVSRIGGRVTCSADRSKVEKDSAAPQQRQHTLGRFIPPLTLKPLSGRQAISAAKAQQAARLCYHKLESRD